MSASTRVPLGETPRDSGDQSPSNATTTTPSVQEQRHTDAQQSPGSGAVQVGASSSGSKGGTGTPITTGKRKDRDADSTEIEFQASKQDGPSSATKRIRTTASDVRTSDGSDALSSETSAPAEVSVQQGDVPRSIGKRKQRDEDGPASVGTSSTSQASSATASSNQTPMTSVSPETEENHPPKKQRLDTDDSVEENPDLPVAEAEAEPKTSPFLTLPLELLADILIRTRSPQHVLATARSCKALFHTLISPDAAFIWREARKGCTYERNTGDHMQTFALPNLPEQFFSEPAYAAFLFDSGPCDHCRNETEIMYHSFALRIRLCKRRTCKWSSKITSHDSIEPKVRAILPSNEASVDVLSTGRHFGQFWPDIGASCYRMEDREVAGYRPGDEEFDMKFEMRAKRKIEWMMFCVNVLKWKHAREESYKRIARHNLTVSKMIAHANGWNYEMFKTTVYGPYLSNKTKLIEEINDVDLEVMRDEIEARLISLGEKRGRRSNEIALMNNRKEVEKTYNRLRSGKDHPYMPSLHTFRTLPVVAMLQSSTSPDSGNIYETFKNDKKMKDLLSNQLKAWTDKAKRDLGALLGCPKNWRSASTKVLHPAERVTARYLCTKCERFDGRYRMHESLDFAGACSHECGDGSGKKARKVTKGKRAIWNPENFVKDEKAVKALKATVEAFNLNDEHIRDLGLPVLFLAIVCNSCSPSMIVDSGSIIGHSHRHEDMQLSFNASRKDIVTMMGGYPYEHGLVEKLLGPVSFTDAGKAEIDRKNFGCRHCLRENQIEDPDGAADAVALALRIEEDEEAAIESLGLQGPAAVTHLNLPWMVRRFPVLAGRSMQGPALPPPPLFNFNGVRSHMKAKHGIKDLRDEDIFCYRDPEIILI